MVSSTVHGTIVGLSKELSIRKLVALIAIVGILSLIPTPPLGHSALADEEKPPSTTRQMAAKSTLTTKTANTQPTQAVPAAPVVQTTTPAPKPVVAASTQPTTHEGLMSAAGISPSDYAAVEYIVSNESGWDAGATNVSSGAHGLPQALPYSKTGCGWNDAICQLKWANTYAKTRYGGWWLAQEYWQQHGNW